MSQTLQRTDSVWLHPDDAMPRFDRLEGDVEADVAVLGGGLVGITTALLLQEAGMDTVLVEASRLGTGVSGHTTAKVSSQHGLKYSSLRSTYGEETARTYGQANQAALEWIARRVEEHGIDCDFRRRPSWAYVPEGESTSDVESEAEAAAQAGLPAALDREVPLPYPVAAGVRFDDQAEFHARKYMGALVEQFVAAGGRAFERSRAGQVDSGNPCLVRLPGGMVRAGHVVVATHYPFLDRSLAFARVHAQRSYAMLCRVRDQPPQGMFLSASSPTRSIRSVPVDGEELLLVGGQGHKTGTGGDSRPRYEALRRFADEHWGVESVEYHWSSQDNESIDQLPLIGQVTPFDPHVLMATGFAKWGITGGTAAALILAEACAGREHDWAPLFDPSRLNLRASVPKGIKENAETGYHMVRDRLVNRGGRAIADLAPGEGDIVQHQGQKVAGYRDDDGQLIAVSTRCTHMGCQVNWNSAERSWDCPCHGSRFATDGEVLQGPAVHRLERKPLD
ncbi:MAG TPA: FAD-dependent oxidoreductase [Thermoleophilaceae bacterium]|nr:FAD-dependent oxidoreductase [Thermoleophilaceae bacterium]